MIVYNNFHASSLFTVDKISSELSIDARILTLCQPLRLFRWVLYFDKKTDFI